MDAHAQLWIKVDRLLWEHWDPIGVNDSAPDDEYRGYVPEIVTMLERKAEVEEIAKHLADIATNRMGLSGDKKEHSRNVAIKLKALMNG